MIGIVYGVLSLTYIYIYIANEELILNSLPKKNGSFISRGICDI